MVKTICYSIDLICPNTRLLMHFWQIKNADSPQKTGQMLYDADRDSYDRTDHFNAYGLSTFFILKQRRAFFEHMGSQVQVIDGFELISAHDLSFNFPHGPDFTLEVF